MNDEPIDDLMARCLAGAGSPADLRQLNALLAADEAARRSWLRLARIDAFLHRRARRQPPVSLLARSNATDARPRSTWARIARRTRESFATPLPLGLAGIVIGMLGASAVWAMVPPWEATGRSVIRVLADGFESDIPPQRNGRPEATGVWGGDQTEIVAAGEGVVPRSGSRMLRFMDGSQQGQQGSRGASCDVVKLIDLRPYRHLIATGEWGVRVTTHCNASTCPARGHDEFAVAAIAFRSLADATDLGPQPLQENSLAYAWCRRILLDDDPATWQSATTELLLPNATECLAVHVSVSEYGRPAMLSPKTFGCHYCDDVVVTLVRRPPAPMSTNLVAQFLDLEE